MITSLVKLLLWFLWNLNSAGSGCLATEAFSAHRPHSNVHDLVQWREGGALCQALQLGMCTAGTIFLTSSPATACIITRYVTTMASYTQDATSHTVSQHGAALVSIVLVLSLPALSTNFTEQITRLPIWKTHGWCMLTHKTTLYAHVLWGVEVCNFHISSSFSEKPFTMWKEWLLFLNTELFQQLVKRLHKSSS